jgi:polygalacturonase
MMNPKFSLCFLLLLVLSGCDNLRNKNSSVTFEELDIQLPEHIEAPFRLPTLKVPVFPDRVFDIQDYGAEEGGAELVTEAFEQAIQDCHSSGGGMVRVPEGKWLTGSIHLKSNVNLHLQDGAEVIFSEDKEAYLPVVLIQRGGFFCYNYSPPIYANEVENIALTGSGILDGQGHHWWPWKQHQPGMVRLFEMGKQGVPVEERVFGTEEDGVRPPFIQFINSKNILIEGITIKNGPSWNLHPVFCENILIRGITIDSHGPNNDGIDIDGCKDVLIEDSLLDVGDDNICLKSGRDEEAWKIGKPTQRVVVRNCKAMAGHGGFVIGSEMSAGVKDVLVYDCEFEGTSRGIRLKSRLGRGGTVENIHVWDIQMSNIQHEAIILSLRYDGEPIERDMGYTEIADSAPPTFRDIELHQISCSSAGTAILFQGLPGGEYLSDILMRNIDINAKEVGSFDNHHRVVKDNVLVNGKKMEDNE